MNPTLEILIGYILFFGGSALAFKFADIIGDYFDKKRGGMGNEKDEM